jgi:hypothetical protein
VLVIIDLKKAAMDQLTEEIFQFIRNNGNYYCNKYGLYFCIEANQIRMTETLNNFHEEGCCFSFSCLSSAQKLIETFSLIDAAQLNFISAVDFWVKYSSLEVSGFCIVATKYLFFKRVRRALYAKDGDRKQHIIRRRLVWPSDYYNYTRKYYGMPIDPFWG